MTLPILVLSLPGCAARLDPLRAALDRDGLPHRVAFGVDARRGLPPEYEAQVDRAGARRLLNRPMTDPEFGCALSHRAAWADVAAGEAPGAIILEDDARPQPGFAAIARGGPLPFPLLQLAYHPPILVLRGGGRRLGGGMEARELALPAVSSVAYWLSRDAAAALLRAATPVRHPADWPCDTTRLGAFIAVPRPVHHAGLPSVIGGGRDPAEVGHADPRRHPLRFMTGEYWRRKWRKHQAVWLSEAEADAAPGEPPP